jgi:molecular chaperone HscB
MYYFDLYQIPISLKIDKSLLTKKYYELSKKYHPDHFSLSDQIAQTDSLDMSAKINEGKSILENQDKRLEYILKGNRTIVEDEKYNLLPNFLGEMMDINEQLMELEFEKNDKILSSIKFELQSKMDELFVSVEPFFEMSELNLSSEEWNLLKDYYYKKKYLNRIQEKLISD